MKKLVILLFIVLLSVVLVSLGGCAVRNRYTADVGNCSSTQILSSVGKFIPNTISVSSDNFGNVRIVNGNGAVISDIALSDSQRKEFIELLDKAIQWSNISKTNSIKTTKGVGRVHGPVYSVYVSLVAASDNPSITLLMSDSYSNRSTSNALTPQEAMCLRAKLEDAPNFIEKAKAMEAKGDLLK